MIELHGNTGFFLGIATDHLVGAAALLLLPFVIHWFWKVPAWAAADDRRRLVAVLLAATGLIHLGLVPGHLAEAPTTAALFLANGLLFSGLALATLSWRRWRPAAALLLLLTLVAYGVYVASGWESVDDLGAVTKLIELFALGLVLLPRTRGALRWSAATGSLMMLTLLVTFLTWGGIIRDHAGALLQAPSARPTAADRVAAAKFASTTWNDIIPYQDVNVAIAAGYRAQAAEATTIHYENKKYEEGSKRPVMDPGRPQGLVYARTPRGPVLLGAMYVLADQNQRGNDFNGAVSGWHLHPNACVSPVSMSLSGLLTPYGNCPPLSFAIITTPMLHVWRPDMPNGAYGELDEKWV
ncbi:MAG: hypothetical protein M3Z98_05140, partial [Candidatus Dormibacteraeota bacterium]|nr:hypothetical protein [Candidatus Dormibacteraeota bacterium]